VGTDQLELIVGQRLVHDQFLKCDENLILSSGPFDGDGPGEGAPSKRLHRPIRRNSLDLSYSGRKYLSSTGRRSIRLNWITRSASSTLLFGWGRATVRMYSGPDLQFPGFGIHLGIGCPRSSAAWSCGLRSSGSAANRRYVRGRMFSSEFGEGFGSALVSLHNLVLTVESTN